MKDTATDLTCPCGRHRESVPLPYDQCCGVFHRGEAAPTAELLMRSRYCAFVVCDADYLLASWHPATRPFAVEFDARQRWLGLKITGTTGGRVDDSSGTVTFVARYKIGGRGYRLEETSRFVRIDGRWLYSGAQ